MTDWNKISAFMAAVVPWPGPGEPGYVNLQHSFHDKQSPDGKRAGKWPVSAGKPFREPSGLVQRAAWMNGTQSFKDQWFCLSLQREAKADPRNAGKLKAVRASANALSLKAIWIDADVKEKGYTTVAECLKALMQFRQDVGLPEFSALVLSGGGVHAYWIATEAMTPDVWRPYAEGLKALLLQKGVKCDAGLTTDQARILRMPGTFNHKYDPPKPVQLLDQPLVCYNFDTQLSFLTEIAPVGSAPGQPAPHTLFAEGARAAFKGATPVLRHSAAEPGLDAGIEKFDDTLIPIGPIMKACGFYRDALKTGGRDHDQPLWNLAVLGATFMENGNNVAHAISSGHAGYTEEGTQALYDRKVAERADRGIGYPSCAAIAGSGCKACATCPLFSKGKSPLNLRPSPPPVTAAVTQSAAAAALSLPLGYDVDDRGIICEVVEKEGKDGETTKLLLPLFLVKLRGFWAKKPIHSLNYTVDTDLGHVAKACVPMSEMAKQGFPAWLMGPDANTMINPDVPAQKLTRFYMSMLNKLWNEASSQEAQPFGWHEDGGQITGFTYGGKTFLEDGNVKPCGIADANLQRYFTPEGNIEPWFEAAKTVTDRCRPELTAIMLVSFAAPLVKIAGHNGAAFSAWGDSGAGKSAAFSVGMAVWGHPLLTKGSSSSTINNVTTQMATTRHLPFYWDEIKDNPHRKRVFEVMHDVTDGVEKGRNVSGSRTQDRGTWALPLIAASNGSFREYLYATNHNHAASINRVLEWCVKKIDGGPGHLDDATATKIISRLTSNYGKMGDLYAEFLAHNHKQIEADFMAMSQELQSHFGSGTAERYWVLEAAMLILAARYAAKMGVQVYEGEIKEWVIGVVQDNINKRDQQGMSGDVNNAEEALSRYIGNRDAEERIIWTNYMHNARGKPPKPVQTLHVGSSSKNTSGTYEVRVAVENREVVIARRDFETWATGKPQEYALTQVYDVAVRDFGLRFEQKSRILSGTDKGDGGGLRQPALIFKVMTPDHPLWPLLWRYSPEDRKVAEEHWAAMTTMSADTGETVVDTGLTPVADVVAFVQGATGGQR